MADHPLKGSTIAVTRPREQAAQLVNRIEDAGGISFLFPLLEIGPVNDGALNEQVARLAHFDMAIFVSPNAVRFGMAAIREADRLPAHLKIATVGQGSAKALREAGVTDIIAPAVRFDSEGLLELPELQDVTGRSVMIFRGDGGRELLGDTLRARGATVEYATCYRRSNVRQDPQALLGAKPDAITVTSSEALSYLRQMLDGDTWKALREIPVFVPHQRIAELAINQGWQHVQLTMSGDEGLLSALIAWAHQKA